VIVALESTGDKGQLIELGRKIAMHVAAASPLALDPAGLDVSTLEREGNVLREKNAGKPPHVLEKIIESGLKTYYKEVTLLEQAYVHDNGKTVAQAVAEAAKTIGAPVALTGFVRYALGEGIEKQEADFAAEVAAVASGQA
jgi:elongation factor Ts